MGLAGAGRHHRRDAGIDLYRHRDDHEPSQKEALIESAIWVSFGLAFGGVIALAFGGQATTEYLSGYVIEKSLSVDNVFVWAMLFATFKIPLEVPAPGAVLGHLRCAAPAWHLHLGRYRAHRQVLVGAAGVRCAAHRHRPQDPAPPQRRRREGAHAGIRLLKKVMPVSDELDGHKFFTKVNAKRAATPLFAALVVVELTDVIFAVDSVPAILAVSNEPFLVFASNAFAIMGLRAMYFLLANAKEKFHFLSHALGIILIYVGVKMSISHWYHIDTLVSLGVIVGLLSLSIWASLKFPKAFGGDDVDAHALHDH
jgi:tellurite resistance protein TerC